MSDQKTLDDIQEAQAVFDRGHEGAVPFFESISTDNLQALEHLVVCLSGELGELANLVKKIRRGDKDLETSRDGLVDETADIFIYTLKLANQLGFNLQDAYDNKMDFNRSRFEKFER